MVVTLYTVRVIVEKKADTLGRVTALCHHRSEAMPLSYPHPHRTDPPVAQSRSTTAVAVFACPLLGFSGLTMNNGLTA